MWQRDLSISYINIGNVLKDQGQLAEALSAFRKCLAIRQRLAAADRSNAQWQRDLQYSVGRMGSISWSFILAGEFTPALETAEQSILLAPDKLWLYANRAHALLFLRRADEARALYLRYRGAPNVQGEKAWETVILEDFADMHMRGLSHPVMNELEAVRNSRIVD